MKIVITYDRIMEKEVEVEDYYGAVVVLSELQKQFPTADFKIIQ